MNHRKNMTFLMAALLLSGTIPAWADGFRNPPEGIQAIGKVGGKVVYMDDASANTHNPANLADMATNSMLASFTFGYGKREFEPAMGGKAESKDPWAVLPNLFANWRINDDNLAAGVGLTTPYGRSSTFPQDSVLRYSTPYFTQLMSINLNPNLAYKVNEDLSIAAGVDILYANLELRQIYPWSFATGNPALPDGKLKAESDGTGFGYNAAVAWDITERQRVALTYRSASKVNFEGDLDISGAPTPVGPMTASSDLETDITFPDLVAFGYGFEITEKWRIEFNVEWVQHSLFDELTLDADENSALLPATTTPADWDDNWTYGFGTDYRLNDEWVLRAGYVYLQTPVPSETMLPSISEENQSVVSIGCGYANGPHRLDFAYAYGIFTGRDVGDNINPAYNGTYDFEAHLLGASYGFTF